MAHEWTKEDNLLALNFYYHKGPRQRPMSLAREIGTTLDSIKLKLKNIEYLDTNGVSGLHHVDKLLIEIFNNYKKANFLQ